MPRVQRACVYLVLGVLWASGCWWLCLDEFYASRGQFGLTPHPWEPAILLLHGVAGIVSMYLLGWITARHILHWWPRRLRRLSGAVFGVSLGLLAVSGFMLFFVSSDRWQHVSALTHDVLGLGITLSGIQHGFFARRRGARP